MRFSYFTAVLVMMASTQAIASVKIPYFRKLSDSEICGGSPKGCKPDQSDDAVSITPLTYSGNVNDFLGRRYKKNLRQSQPCWRDPSAINSTDLPAGAFQAFGQNSFKGELTNADKPAFKASLALPVSKIVNRLTSGLPAHLKADASAAYNQSVDDSLTSSITLDYERVELTRRFKDNELQKCLAATSRREWVITGISTIKVSGSWTKKQIEATIAHIESTLAFQELSQDARKDWNNHKDETLKGTFEPVQFVIAVGAMRGQNEQ